MLSQEIRDKEIKVKSEHFPRMCKERKHLFPLDFCLKEMWEECKAAIRDPMKGIFLEDKRTGEGIQSNYVCVFIGTSGRVIALPCYVDGSIILFTIKDVENEFHNPNWFINGYNEICSRRGMQLLPLIVRHGGNQSQSF